MLRPAPPALTDTMSLSMFSMPTDFSSASALGSTTTTRFFSLELRVSVMYFCRCLTKSL